MEFYNKITVILKELHSNGIASKQLGGDGGVDFISFDDEIIYAINGQISKKPYVDIANYFELLVNGINKNNICFKNSEFDYLSTKINLSNRQKDTHEECLKEIELYKKCSKCKGYIRTCNHAICEEENNVRRSKKI